MRILGMVFLFLATAIFGAPASADHLTGRYQGTGDVANITLDLTQTGTNVKGVISGNDTGSLEGTTDGGDIAQGIIRLDNPNTQPFQFQAQWSQQGLAMRLFFPNQPRDVFFQKVSAGQPQPPQPPPPPPPGPKPPGPPPIPGPSDVQYFVAVNGQQVGPLTLNDVVIAIQQKQIGPTDLVWKTGAAGWAAANTYPELQAAFAAPPPPPPPPPPGGGGGPPPLPPGGGGGDPNAPGGNTPTPPGGGGGDPNEPGGNTPTPPGGGGGDPNAPGGNTPTPPAGGGGDPNAPGGNTPPPASGGGGLTPPSG